MFENNAAQTKTKTKTKTNTLTIRDIRVPETCKNLRNNY